MIRLGRAEIPPTKADADRTTPIVPRQRTESSVPADRSEEHVPDSGLGTTEEDDAPDAPGTHGS